MPISERRVRAPPPLDPARARRPRRDALPRRRAAALRLRRARSTRRSSTKRGVLFRSPQLSLALETRVPHGLRAGRARTASSRCSRARRRPSCSSRCPRRTSRASTRRARRARRSRRPSSTGAAGSSQSPLRGPLARDHLPLGADAQADDVPADGRDRRRADDEPARAHRRRCGTATTATRGSATPRSRCTRCCASASPRRPPRSWTG